MELGADVFRVKSKLRLVYRSPVPLPRYLLFNMSQLPVSLINDFLFKSEKFPLPTDAWLLEITFTVIARQDPRLVGLVCRLPSFNATSWQPRLVALLHHTAIVVASLGSCNFKSSYDVCSSFPSRLSADSAVNEQSFRLPSHIVCKFG